MMKSCGLLLVLLAAHSAYAGLTPSVFVDYAKRGAVLTYDVDVTKCDVNLPSTLSTYSFGEVMQGVHTEDGGPAGWRLFSCSERPVNSSRFQTDNGAWRVTEVEVTSAGHDDATAVITLTDVEEGGKGTVLATGNMSCKISTGGFSVNVQRMPGQELGQETQVLEAFHGGQQMTFSIDLTACTMGGHSGAPEQWKLGASSLIGEAAASRVWSALITDYRIPHNGGQSVEFTSIVYTSQHREVVNVRVQDGNQIEVKAYPVYRPPRHPTPVVTYHCSLGTAGSFHIYRV